MRVEADSESRLNIITKKDIHNIKVSIDPSSSLPDELSVKIWVKEIEKEGHLLLCYKEQDVEHPDLDRDVFFLAFMFKEQLAMFQEFGSDRIFIDSTHGITGYNFELITITVIDEF